MNWRNKVFKKLRIKIIVVLMSALAILLISILTAIYIVSFQKSTQSTELVLRKLCWENGFDLLKNYRINSKNNKYNPSIYYLVQIGEDQTIIEMSNDKNSGYSNKELGKIAISISQTANSRGSIGVLSYYKSVRRKGIFVAFVNNSIQKSYYHTLFYTMLTFGLIGLMILLILSIWLSRWLIAPVEKAFQKQQQFLSDASHELKTPITIISSNADALEREIGESKWIEYIKNETKRLTGLVTDLLQLTTSNFNEGNTTFTRFNLSEIVMSIVLPFEGLAYEKQISFNEHIVNNIYFMGDSGKLGQLTGILIDNALNYSDKGGEIYIILKKYRERIILMVTNTGQEIPLADRELVFERFYRIDEARSRETGNYGLGLAIAKSIVISHNGKISVHCKNNTTTFKVVL